MMLNCLFHSGKFPCLFLVINSHNSDHRVFRNISLFYPKLQNALFYFKKVFQFDFSPRKGCLDYSDRVASSMTVTGKKDVSVYPELANILFIQC